MDPNFDELNIVPSLASSSQKQEFGTVVSNFGHGYRQAVADGINFKQESWELAFNNKPETEIQSIRDFLDARGGHESFSWTSPKSTTLRKWINLEGYDVSYESADNIGTLTCTLTLWYGD